MYDCIKFRTKHSWCSLNKTYQGYWKYCSEEDYAKCAFPFWYKRLIYWECTEDGDAFGKKWCSLTQNYNKNKIWKYCLIARVRLPAQELRDCVFPFTYHDAVYHNCISTHSDFDWCSLDKDFKGRWRYCTGNDPPKCSFPFLFRKEVFNHCTKKGFILDRSWCSLTGNYNEDGKWKQCSPY
ncbi:Binder of sperm protein-2, partial [Galemys pyrenaicus]